MPAPRRAPLLATLLTACATAQSYKIATVAGGGIPNGVPGPSASLNGTPHGVAVDGAGNLFFTDGHTVLKLAAGTGVLSLAAGNGATGAAGDNGPATDAELYNPHGLAVDSAGALYIADTFNHRVRKVSGGVITTVAGNGTAAALGDNGPATEASLNAPQAVAVDAAGNLFVSDTGNNRIRKVSAGVITTVAGSGGFGYSGDNGPAVAALLNFPQGIAVDAAGNLYIADNLNQRVRKVSNGIITTFAGNGVQGFSGESVLATNAQFNYPSGLALDSTGSLYISDLNNSRVRKLSNGIITTLPGAIGLSAPEGVSVDSAGRVYVADSFSFSIRRIAAGVMTTVAGNGVQSFGGDNGPALRAQFTALGIALDPAGSLYIADRAHRIRKIANGVITTIAGTGQEGSGGDGGPALASTLVEPDSVAADSLGNVYIADALSNRIRKISPAGIIMTIAGTGAQGFAGDDGPALTAKLSISNSVAVNAFGDIYIADSGNYRVRKISGGVIRTVAGTGVAGFSGDNGAATSAQLGGQVTIALDGAGDLYIADTQNQRIRKVSNGVIRTVAGNGVFGRPVENVPATQSPLSFPTSVAIGADGVIYIADSGNRVVRRVADNRIVTIAGNGEDGYRGENVLATSANVTPFALAVDPTGVVLVSDGTRIRALTPVPAITPGGISNAATFDFGARVAPGSIATAFGSFLVPSLVTASTPRLPDTLAGLTLQFDTGRNAPLFAVSPGQVNFQIPWELAGHSPVLLSPTFGGRTGFPESLLLATYAPGIFRMNFSTGQGAIVDANYRLVDATNPAAPGDIVIIFCTGLGPVANQPPTGSPALFDVLSPTLATPQVNIGGVPATVLFSGLAPGSVGEYQVNVIVPSGAAKGPASAVSIIIGGTATIIGGALSNTVSMAVH
jgi:trimeric autotransporter adhesin